MNYYFRMMMSAMQSKKAVLLLLTLFATPALGSAAELFVAKVNGAGISEQDVAGTVSELIPKGTFHGAVTDEKKAEFRSRAIEALIDYELMFQAGRSEGLRADRSSVKNELKSIRSTFPSEQDYRNALAQNGWTESTLKAKIEKKLIVSRAIENHVLTPARVSEKELRDFYEANQSRFKKPESVKLRMFYSGSEARAREVLARIRGGEDFATLASQLSEENYRVKGGDLGYVHRGRIYPELEPFAFGAEVGSLSDVISARGGWFILRVEDKQPSVLIPFDEAKGSLQKDLEKKNQGELRKQWLASLRSKAVIERVNVPPTPAAP